MNVDRLNSSSRYREVGQVERKSTDLSLERREVAGSADVTSRLLAQSSPTLMIQAMQVFSRDMQKDAGQNAILGKKSEIEQARQQIQEAMDRAQKEATEKGKWGGVTSALMTVAKVAAVAAAVSSIVVTGGVSAPLLLGLAGTLVSVMAKPASKAFGGGETMEKVMLWGGAGLSVAAGGAALFSSAAPTASGLAAAIGTRSLQVSTAVGGGATSVSGYTSYKAGEAGAKMIEAQADQKSIRAEQKKMLGQMEQLIGMLQELEQSFSKSMSTVQSARESEAASGLTLAAGVRG